MTIYEKINKIMSEVQSLKKDGKVAFGSTKYNYLSEAKTTEIFREKLIENKLVLLPVYAQESKDGAVTHGVYTYNLVNVENPEEHISLMAGGQGHDSADKGSGKASSYAYKYLLWRTFAVPSNDDPDQVSSAEISAQAIPDAEEINKQQDAALEKLKKEAIEKAGSVGLDAAKFKQFYQKKYGVEMDASSIRQLKIAVSDLDKKIAETDPFIAGLEADKAK